jgi:NADPH:quinone reductase-like Zn-dependent oxidoreductase
VKAATIRGYGGPEMFAVEDIPAPVVGPRDVLVEVRAAAINPVDCKMRRGGQRAIARLRFPAVLGLDVSGVVVEVGRAVTRFSPGDEVYASPTHRRQGTYAERIAIAEDELARKPARVSHVEAAALPLVGLTAWRCLVDVARVRAGERVFVQAGAGGVGTFAIQLARHLGAEVATTCSERNADLCRRLGATTIVDHARERYDDVLRDHDVVLESLGGEHIVRSARALRRGGRLVYITTDLADRGERLGPYLGLAATVGAIAWRWTVSRLARKPASAVVRSPSGERLAKIAELVDTGAITPIIDRTFALADIVEAHRVMETGRTRGKLVLDIG